jgi:hypothetical protein
VISLRYVAGTTTTPRTPISLRAYAKRRAAAGLPGSSPEAVSKAVKAGRLSRSVVLVDGEPKIADPELADREWLARSAPRIVARGEGDQPVTAARTPPPSQPIAPPGGRGRAQAPAAAAPGNDHDDDQDGGESYQAARTRKERAAADRETALAGTAKIELAQLRGQVGRVADFKAKLVNAFTTCRTKLAALPARARSRDPSLTLAQVELLESLVREVLAELAG